MPDISISVDSKAVSQLLQRAPDRLDIALRGTLEDGSSYYLVQMKRYPAQRAGSTYRRTNTLSRSWSVRPITRLSSGWRVVIGSNGLIAPYNRRVQDRDHQAAVHRSRWRTAQTVAEQSTSQIQRFADARFRMALGGL